MTSEQRRRKRELQAENKRHNADKERRQKQLFKPVDVQRNLITGKEELDPARPRTDLEAGADDATKGPNAD